MNLKNIIFVHRGKLKNGLEENSLEAFNECVKNNKNIELDLHILKDGNVIVFHDKDLKRICGINIDIKNLSYDDIIKNCSTIPLFIDVLKLVNSRVILDIELKYDVLNGNLENKVLEILDNYNGKYILKSFHPLIVWRLKRLIRKKKMNIKVGLLVKNPFILLFSMIFINPDFISLNYKSLNNCFFRFFSKRKDTLLYTIKSKDIFLKYINKGYGLVLEDYENLIK